MAFWRSTNDGRRTPRPEEVTEMPVPAAVTRPGDTKQCDACTSVGIASGASLRHAEAADCVERQVIDGIELWLCMVPQLCTARAKALGIWMRV